MRKVRLWLALMAILVATAAGAQSTISVTAAEYFFDTDPGYGKATVINNAVEGEQTLDIPTSALSTGAHTLCVRSLGSNGVWSSTMTKSVYVMHVGSSIQSLEYFFDTDPGYGKGTVLVLGGAKDVTLDINTATIAPGAHMLYLRTQDTNGNWSSVMAHPLYVFTVLPVAALEYFIDNNDPGEGKAISVPVATATAATATFDIDTSVLTPGEHTLNIRAMGIDSVWTAVSTRTFNVEGAVVSEPEPYAVLTGDTLLTFYYDDQKNARNGMGVGPFTEDGDREWNNWSAQITKAVFDESFANDTTVTSTAYWFSGMSKLAAIDGLEYLKTKNVTDMSRMFYGCSSLTSLDVSGFNTAKVTDMSHMFYECSGLTSLDVTKFNTTNVKNMFGMFLSCSHLTSLDVSSFNTANVTNLGMMFLDCSGLTSLDVSNFNTANATNMYAMFSYCSNLTSLDLTKFNTANVTDMHSMFLGCYVLTSLDVSNFNTANVTDMSHMFYECVALKTIFAGSEWSTSSVTYSENMFGECTDLVGGKGTVFDANHIDAAYAHIDGGPSNPGYFTDKNAPVIAEAYAVLSDDNTVLTFYYDTEKQARGGMSVGPFSTLDDRGWNYETSYISKVVFDESFANDTTVTSTAYWFSNMSILAAIDGLEYLKTKNVTNMSNMFYTCYNLTNLNVSNFNTDNVTDMEYMFFGCYGLTSLNVSNFNTDNVTDMSGMFSRCYGLTSLDVSGFKTQNVTNMNDMFYDCSKLTSLDVSGFKTDNVTDMSDMFSGCYGLTSLDVSGFNTANVTNMSGMFSGCYGLTSLDVSGFNTANVTNMIGMFSGCYGLTSLDVSGFNTANVTSMVMMFADCSSLMSLDLSNFKTDNVTNMYYMFWNCSSLTSLDVTGFNTQNVTDMSDIFAECSSLAAIQAGSAAIPAEEYAKVGNPNLLVYVNDASVAPTSIQNVVVNGLAKEIVLTDEAGNNDNNNFFVPQSFTAEKVSYTRNFTQQTQPNVSRGWESISLPFNVQNIVHESKGDLSPFGSSAEGKKFWLRRLADNGLTRASQIEANVPYVISMPNSTEYTDLYNLSGRVTFSAQNTTVPATTPQTLSLSDGSIDMVPTTLRVNRSSSVWALNVGEVRGQYLEGSVFERDYRMVRPFQAYTVHNSNGPAPRFVPISEMDSGATGIEDLTPYLSKGEGAWYDLNGRKLQQKPTQKGVYILNGTKVVIK